MWKRLHREKTGKSSGGGATASPDALIGTIIGSYRVMARIAEGGMGIIYRAEHLRLPRQVAIKVLKPELARFSTLIDRFVDEARAVNQIGHPNLVDIMDVDEIDGDPKLVYLVMELLEGTDLARHLRDVGALDPLEAVEIADAVAEAMISVHQHQILHRDLKAENIFLVRRPDGSSCVKLLDFGIATRFGGRAGRKLTSPGARVGTPDCMAPEQVSGETLDERTDIYALGLVLYHMLNGAPAFHSTSINDVLSDQLYAKPPPIRRARLSGDQPIPAALEQVVMRCLEKKREDRFADVKGFREAMWASLGVEVGGRSFLHRHGREGKILGEAPTLPPHQIAAALPDSVKGLSLWKRGREGDKEARRARPPRVRWIATGALAGVAIPLVGLLLRGPVLTAANPKLDQRCVPVASSTVAPQRPGSPEGGATVASVSADRLEATTAPLLQPRKATPAADADAAATARAVHDDTSLEARRRGWRGRSRSGLPAVEERAAPAAGKADPPAGLREPLDRTVDPFSLDQIEKPAVPLASRDRI